MIQHVLLFLLITLISSLVYHALRVDCVKSAAITGLRRFVSFVLVGGVSGVLLWLFTRWV